MPRVCSVCTHPERAAIDAALLGGEPYRRIASRLGASTTALQRHKAHIPAHLSTAHEAEAVASADDLLDQVRALQRKALDLLSKAEREGDYRTALAGVREARACLELLLEVSGELDRRSVVNIAVNPQWIQLRTVIVAALEPYPEARLAVADAIESRDGSRDP